MLRNLLRVRHVFLGEVQVRNAGHSKWANIKHTKALKDGQRAKEFTKLGRMIRVAIQEGGSIDPKHNLRLEQVLEQARRSNMPTATVQSVIKSTQTDKAQCRSHIVEIKGPGGCIILCEVFTDHLHHMKQTMATIIKKYRCKFSDGGGQHLFEQKGVVRTELPRTDGQDALEVATDDAIECGAEDVELADDELRFTCGSTNLAAVLKELEKRSYKIKEGSVDFVALKTMELTDEELETAGVLYEKLEAMPEVVRLHDNIA